MINKYTTLILAVLLTGCSGQETYDHSTYEQHQRSAYSYTPTGNVRSCKDDQASLNEIECLRKQGEHLNRDVDSVLGTARNTNNSSF